MKKKIFVLLLVFFIAVPSISADQNKQKTRTEFFDGIHSEIDYILENYYGEIDEETLRKGLLNGMHEVVDPWTESYSYEEYNEFINSLSGDYVGLGVYIEKVNDFLLINEVIENSAAAEVGLKENDRIYEVDGKLIKDLALKEAIDLIKGAKNTKVKLKIKRSDAKNSEYIDITRKEFVVKSVKHYVQDDVDVIKIIQFGENTYNELKQILNKNEFKNGIILDLRDNPGGYLEICKNIADEFLEKNKIITIVESKAGKEILTAKKPARKEKLVVLINANSASASELFTAALKENERALILGDTSYGKGLIQEMGITGNRYIKLTEGEYKSPKSNVINKVGVKPDVFVNIEEELFNIHSSIAPMLSYTEFKKGDVNKEMRAVIQRFNYLGETLPVIETYDEALFNVVQKFKKEHSLKDDGLINLDFKKALEKEVENKALERVKERQLQRAIAELKKMK